METVLRVAYVYVVLMLGLRVMGKRELSKLSPFELITLLLVPELFQQAMIREDFSMTNATVAVATLFSLVFATSVVSYLFPKAGTVIAGEPAVLVHNGTFQEEAMNRERIPPSEIYAEMHQVGLEELSQVKWAILEADGKIALVPARPADKQLRPRQEAAF